MIWSWYVVINSYSYFMDNFHICKIILVVYINYILGASKEYNNIPLKYLFDYIKFSNLIII